MLLLMYIVIYSVCVHVCVRVRVWGSLQLCLCSHRLSFFVFYENYTKKKE